MLPKKQNDSQEHLSEEFVLTAINIWRTTIEDWITLGNVHIVHYENILQNKMREIRNIMNFLHIPVQNWRQHCVKHSTFDMYQRKNGTQPVRSPYSKSLKRYIWKNIYMINDMLVKYGHEHLPFDKYTIP